MGFSKFKVGAQEGNVGPMHRVNNWVYFWVPLETEAASGLDLIEAAASGLDLIEAASGLRTQFDLITGLDSN